MQESNGMGLAKQKRILCVDDSRDNCELLLFILSNEGYQIEMANSVVEALHIAQAGNFDLYLMDLAYKDGSGFDLIQAIREFDSLTPIMICSGNVSDAAQEEAQRVGVQCFLAKPIDPEVLVQAVVGVLECSPQPEALPNHQSS